MKVYVLTISAGRWEGRWTYNAGVYTDKGAAEREGARIESRIREYEQACEGEEYPDLHPPLADFTDLRYVLDIDESGMPIRERRDSTYDVEEFDVES